MRGRSTTTLPILQARHATLLPIVRGWTCKIATYRAGKAMHRCCLSYDIVRTVVPYRAGLHAMSLLIVRDYAHHCYLSYRTTRTIATYRAGQHASRLPIVQDNVQHRYLFCRTACTVSAYCVGCMQHCFLSYRTTHPVVSYRADMRALFPQSCGDYTHRCSLSCKAASTVAAYRVGLCAQLLPIVQGRQCTIASYRAR